MGCMCRRTPQRLDRGADWCGNIDGTTLGAIDPHMNEPPGGGGFVVPLAKKRDFVDDGGASDVRDSQSGVDRFRKRQRCDAVATRQAARQFHIPGTSGNGNELRRSTTVSTGTSHSYDTLSL